MVSYCDVADGLIQQLSPLTVLKNVICAALIFVKFYFILFFNHQVPLGTDIS